MVNYGDLSTIYPQVVHIFKIQTFNSFIIIVIKNRIICNLFEIRA
jgi:hypothetical protein